MALGLAVVSTFWGTIRAQEENDTTSFPGYQELDEFVIEAEKPVMQSDGAKLTYNVDEDPSAGSSNALDILKKVPQVTVDGDGNVRLNGSEAFKFQVNGLDNPMLKQYAGQILQAMPGSAIVKIEVITEPGAKEDAEGTAGIINIITERTRTEDGYSGRVALQLTNRNLTPSLYGVMKKDKFTISANLNYQWGFAPNHTEQDITTTYLNGAEPTMLNTYMSQKMKHQYVGGSLDMSWEPNVNNLFNAGAELFYVDGKISSLNGTTRFYMPGGQDLWSYDQNGDARMKILNLSANASYRHNFGRHDNFLVLTYLYNFGRNDLTLSRMYENMVNYNPEYLTQRDLSNTFDRGHTVQADYSNNFSSKHHLMELGVKGIFRHNTALADYEYGMAPDGLQLIPELSTFILQPQNIYAAYGSYTGTFGPFSIIGGLRYEHTLMGITDYVDPEKTFRKRLNDWVPNIAATWSFSPASNLRAAYQMRISRPSISQVDPFELSFTPYQINKGNPDLMSERNHIVSLKYSAFGRVVGGMIGLEYNLSDNSITRYSYLLERDGFNTLVSSFANMGKKQDAAVTGFFNWNIIHNMSLSINGRLAYNHLNAPAEGLSNHGWSGNIGGSWNYSVADVYKFSAYGNWMSKSVTLQGHRSGFYYYGLSAARDFLADKSLTLSLSANNFITPHITFSNYIKTPEMINDNISRSFSFWSVGISLSWKFGSLKGGVKKTGVEVKNDDINTTSNKEQGTGGI